MSRIESLIGTLVERYGLNRSEAEEFVTSIFGVVRDNLDKDKIVKVKGLGTFKLADVNSRESIDVNTKERIVIEGRAKISFTPENAVRDRINSPFSQFETVDLDDDVDFSSIDDKYNEKEDEEVESEVVADDKPAIEEPQKTEVDAVVEESPEDEKTTPTEILIEDETEQVIPDASDTIEREQAQENIEPAVSEVKEINSAEQKTEDNKQEFESAKVEPLKESKRRDDETSESVRQPQVTVPARNPFCEELIREGITHSREIIRLLYLLLALVVIVLLIGAVCLGYKMGANAAMKQVAPVKPAAHKVVVVKKKQVVAKPVEKSVPSDTLKQDAKKADTLALMQEEYNKDVRVRTGAYCIMGLDKVITVREGQTFESICRSSLGEGMECYVEVFNAGKTKYKIGDEIKIPLLKLKKRMKK